MGIAGNAFKGIANTPVSNRLPDPLVGEADWLLQSARFKENRDGGERLSIVLTCLRGYSEHGNQKGDTVSTVIWQGNYFLKEFKQFLMAVCDITPDKEDTFVDTLCPKEDYPELDDLQRRETAWELASQLVCAIDSEGNETEAGMMDNQAIIHTSTVVKEGKPNGKYIPNPAYDPSNPESEKFIEEVGKDFINTFYRHHVPASSFAEELTDPEKIRFFGSVVAFNVLAAQ